MDCQDQINKVKLESRLLGGLAERIDELLELLEGLTENPDYDSCAFEMNASNPLDDSCLDMLGDAATWGTELFVLKTKLQDSIERSFAHLQELLECGKAAAEGKPFPPGQQI